MIVWTYFGDVDWAQDRIVHLILDSVETVAVADLPFHLLRLRQYKN